jgi:ABC-2 type transport system ATP-binding protein
LAVGDASVIPAINIRQLSKYYKLPGKGGWKFAVDDLNLEILPEEVFAFLGANGAGKTTTIKVLLNFLKPTSGTAEIFGVDVSSPLARKDVGYLPEQPYFHKFLTPMEVLNVHAALVGIKRSDRKSASEQSLEATGLTDYRNTPIAKLSNGVTQRVGIDQALVGDPKLLILDEPASGLDPIARRQVRDLLFQLKESGKTIFLSSHLLSEIESVCDRVAILSYGKLMAAGTPDSIKKSDSRFAVTTTMLSAEASLQITKIGGTVDTGNNESLIQIDSDHIFDLMKLLEKQQTSLISVIPTRESLEDAFLRLAA